jgi:hypothetical protein
MSIRFLLLFSFLCTIFSVSGQEQPRSSALEWSEWEQLFEPFEKPALGESRLQLGFHSAVFRLNASMKRKQEYFGKYPGEGFENGIYLQTRLVRQVDLRFGLFYSHIHFQGENDFERQTHIFDIRMEHLRIPINVVYTFKTPYVQPQFSLGFNMGGLLQSRGHSFFQKDAQARNYWTSTITSGLDLGLALRVPLGGRWLLHAGGGMSLVVLNPFDNIREKQLRVALGYRL